MGAVQTLCCAPQCDPGSCGDDPFKSLGLVRTEQFTSLSMAVVRSMLSDERRKRSNSMLLMLTSIVPLPQIDYPEHDEWGRDSDIDQVLPGRQTPSLACPHAREQLVH